MTTPLQASILANDHGQFILKGLFQVYAVSISWGIYLCIVPFALTLLLRQGLRQNKARMVTFAATIFMFLVTTTYLIFLLRGNSGILQVRLAGATAASAPGDVDRFAESAQFLKMMKLLQSWPRVINFTVGDAIVVWRAFKIGPRSRPFRLAAFGLLWASTAITFADGVKQSLGANKIDGSLDPNSERVLDALAVSLSFATNLVATCAIGHTAWKSRSVLSKAFPSSSPSPALRILVILAETGLVYLLLQFIAIILLCITTKIGSSLDIWSRVYFSTLNVLSGLFPTIVIILCGLKTTLADALEGSPKHQQQRSYVDMGLAGKGYLKADVTLPPLTMEMDGKLVHVI